MPCYAMQVMDLGPRFVDAALLAYTKQRPCMRGAVVHYSYDQFLRRVGVHAWAGSWHCGHNCSAAERDAFVPKAGAGFSLARASYGKQMQSRDPRSAAASGFNLSHACEAAAPASSRPREDLSGPR